MSEKITWSDDQLAVLNHLKNSNDNIYITGNAGSGKTTLLKEIVRTQPRCVVCAPTGIAALNAGGVTIHSLLRLPIRPYKPMYGRRGKPIFQLHPYLLSEESIKVTQAMDTLIIDEISMVRADLMDAMNDALCFYRECHEPFGGVRVIMMGDLFQLPPVTTVDDWGVVSKFYDSEFFFDAHIFRYTKLVPFKLNTVFRQKDNKFVDILNRIRIGDISNNTSGDINNLLYKPNFIEDNKNWVTIVATNDEASRINQNKLNKVEGKQFKNKAVVTGNIKIDEVTAEDELILKEGCRVMSLVNDTSGGMYVNGSIGTYITNKKIEATGDTVLVVDFDGIEVDIPIYNWLKTAYSIGEDNKMESTVTGKCSQYPLKLAWAITTHKSQGLTFDNVMVDMKYSFANGQVYVALSRGTSIDGTVLINKIKDSQISLSKSFIKRLSEKGLL